MLCDKIKEYRTLRGLTRTELAAQCGVSREAIKFWENGAHEPSAGNLIALSRALGVLPDVLLDIDENDYIYVGSIPDQDKTYLVALAQRLRDLVESRTEDQ